MSYRKAISLFIVGGLTTTTVSACYWQSNRYIQAKNRWTKLGQQFNKESAEQIDLSNIPYKDNAGLYDWEYQLVQIKGYLQEKNQFIWRYYQGQYGYQIINALKNDNGEGIIVNLGWIPSRMKARFEESNPFSKQTRIFTGMIKKAEVKDYLNQQSQNLKSLSEYQSYIDLESLSQHYGLNNSENNKLAYLDKFECQYNTNEEKEEAQNIQNQIKTKEDDHLYPLVPTVDSYTLPFLTPNKHLEYASFWGICSFVGITSIIKIIRIK